jgi:hypothetical protein
MAGKEPRDIRVVWIRPVPGLAFIAGVYGNLAVTHPRWEQTKWGAAATGRQ